MTEPRWIGYCHGCRRDDREVETRHDRAARSLCDTCATRAQPQAVGSPEPLLLTEVGVPVPVPVPVPSIEKQGLQERPDLRVELDRCEAGEVDANRVPTMALPSWATAAMRDVLDDLAFCSGVLRAAGDDGTVIYAVDWAARRVGRSGSTVSIALRALRRCGAIRLVKVLPRTERRHRAGSRVYAVTAPADVLPAEAGGIETGRAPAVHEDDEVRDVAAVRRAVADDAREVVEADDGVIAAGKGAGVGSGGAHDADRTPTHGGSDVGLITALAEAFDAVEISSEPRA